MAFQAVTAEIVKFEGIKEGTTYPHRVLLGRELVQVQA